VQASPTLRIFATIAPATAACDVAVVEDEEGALLPPSSIETAAPARPPAPSASARPRSKPVKDSLRARWSAISGPISLPELCDVQNVEHAVGEPGALEDVGQRGALTAVSSCAGLTTIVQPAGDRRADLARPHREREVPRRDEQARPDGLTHHQQCGACPFRRMA